MEVNGAPMDLNRRLMDVDGAPTGAAEALIGA